MTSKLERADCWEGLRGSIRCRHFDRSPMSERTNQHEKLLVEGAKRLLARATDDHSLDTNALIPRIKAVVDKYLLRDDENAATQSISEFIDGLQADDLCLIVADRKSTRLNSSHLVISYAVFFLQKSTRLNSSHLVISYAVFCLKKKKQQ